MKFIVTDTRRKPRKEKINRLNQSQSLDSNNDDLNVSDSYDFELNLLMAFFLSENSGSRFH